MVALSYEFVKAEIEKDKDYLLISTKYSGAKKKLTVFYLPTNTYYETQFHIWTQNSRPHKLNSLKVNIDTIKTEFSKEKDYKLLSDKYTNQRTPLSVLHVPSSTIFNISWHRWKQGIRWYKNKVNTKTIAKETENLNFTLLNNYENARTYLKIQCNKQHIFDILWRNFEKNKTCPICNPKENKIKGSIGEKLIDLYLSSNNIEFSREYKFPDCKYQKSLRFDFAIHKNKQLQFLIEYQGIQHYEVRDVWEKPNDDLATRQLRDKIKKDYCQNNNIPLLIIRYDEDVTLKLSEWIKNYDL